MAVDRRGESAAAPVPEEEDDDDEDSEGDGTVRLAMPTANEGTGLRGEEDAADKLLEPLKALASGRGSRDQLERVQRAYDILYDDKMRKIYDNSGEDGVELAQEQRDEAERRRTKRDQKQHDEEAEKE